MIPGVLLAKKVQAGAEEQDQHYDSVPEEVLKLLKPVAVYASASLSEKGLLDMDNWTFRGGGGGGRRNKGRYSIG